MKTICIPCNKLWFERVKNGEPDLRPITPYWSKRLKNKAFDTITFTLGYPKKDDESRRYVIPFRGFIEHNGMFVISTQQHTTS